MNFICPRIEFFTTREFIAIWVGIDRRYESGHDAVGRQHIIVKEDTESLLKSIWDEQSDCQRRPRLRDVCGASSLRWITDADATLPNLVRDVFMDVLCELLHRLCLAFCRASPAVVTVCAVGIVQLSEFTRCCT